jgi:hypothetical protein
MGNAEYKPQDYNAGWNIYYRYVGTLTTVFSVNNLSTIDMNNHVYCKLCKTEKDPDTERYNKCQECHNIYRPNISPNTHKVGDHIKYKVYKTYDGDVYIQEWDKETKDSLIHFGYKFQHPRYQHLGVSGSGVCFELIESISLREPANLPDCGWPHYRDYLRNHVYRICKLHSDVLNGVPAQVPVVNSPIRIIYRSTD